MHCDASGLVYREQDPYEVENWLATSQTGARLARRLALVTFLPRQSVLVRHPRRAFRREELLERVWGSRYGDTSTVTVLVRRLREKVEDTPSGPVHLVTVWGIGYRWEP